MEESSKFQSPQWGDNSKASSKLLSPNQDLFQSPQWGDNSKASSRTPPKEARMFQSPQWGDNSKEMNVMISYNAF